MPALFDDLPEQPAPPAQVSGAPRLRRPVRDRMILSPGSLDAMLPADHQARLVDALVTRFDLGPLRDAIKSREGTPGHPAVDVALLVTPWLYAGIDGIRGARELARLCELSLPHQFPSAPEYDGAFGAPAALPGCAIERSPRNRVEAE